jgi:vacuolar-type H+-ATPase subunit E/Vma4
MTLSNLLDVSKRQDPVIDSFCEILDEAKAIAAAISDNAIEEQRPIPTELLRSFNNDLERIKAHLLTAADVPEKIHLAS